MRSLLSSNDPLENLEPRKSRGLSSPQCRPACKSDRLALHSHRRPRARTIFPRKPSWPSVLPLPKHLTAAAMLTTPDCVDEIGPTLQSERNSQRFPSGNSGGGRDSKAQEERGGNESRLSSRQGGGAGEGRLQGAPWRCSRQSFVPVFRGSGSTVQPPSGKICPSWKMRSCWRCSNYFIPFYLFDSVSVLRTIILINCESTQENTTSRKSALTTTFPAL